MKTTLSVLVFAFFGLVQTLNAQSAEPSRVYKDWLMLGESKSLIDVFARVVDCDQNSPSIHIYVLNENVMDQTAHFELAIKDASGKEFTRIFNFAIAKTALHKAECGETTHNSLKIPVPQDYDPDSLEITVQFK